MIEIIGIPYDENSSYLRGAALAPDHIRKALHCGSMNLTTENGINLENSNAWRDAGNIKWQDETPTKAARAEAINEFVSNILKQGHQVLTLGGDHSITFPLVQAHAKIHPELTILHLDAHPDLYDELDANRYSHASPFARIMEHKLAKRLIQVGIRTLNAHQLEQAERFKVEIISMNAFTPNLKLQLDGPVYISLDLDVLDPAFAPGVSHHEPGGMSTRDLITFLHSLNANVIGADLVEYNPTRDLVGMTAMVAAKLTKELLTLMMR